MRLRLVPKETSWDFFSRSRLWLGISAFMMVVAFISFLIQGLNFGIDFRGGTTIRTDSTQAVDVGEYREALAPLDLGDFSITEVFDPTFGPDENVTLISVQAQEGDEAVAPETIEAVREALGSAVGATLEVVVSGEGVDEAGLSAALSGAGFSVADTEAGASRTVFRLEGGQPFGSWDAIDTLIKGSGSVEGVSFQYDGFTFPAVESVGPTVSGELVRTAALAVLLAIGAVLVYIWLRFEWQFALGAVAALVHDVILTIGVFSELQIRFDLAIIAALLTIVGYSLNDTVVVFDRVRENLRRYKKKPLRDVLNQSINETLSRTVMTSVTTLLALISLYVLGGDVIRGFVFAMIWGVIVGTYSSIFVASAMLLWLGVKRDWSKPDDSGPAGTQFAKQQPEGERA